MNTKTPTAMKKTPSILFLATVVLFVMAACKPDPMNHFTDGVKVTTLTPQYISGSAAVCGAEVTAPENGLLIELGVCCGLTERPTIDDRSVNTYRCSQPFQGILLDLEPNTEYHLRGYAKYGTEYVYGDEKIFTTLNDTTGAMDFLTTLPATEVAAYNFLAGGELTMPSEIISSFRFQYGGVCFGPSPDLDIDHCERYVGNWVGNLDNPFLFYIDGLRPNTQYYYRAFLSYSDSEDHVSNTEWHYLYGNVLSVTTPDIPLELTLYAYYPYYDWYYNSAQLYGDMYCNKPEVIDEVGFCYSYNNEYPQYESDLFITVATPTSPQYSFEGTLVNLSANARYYVRSYARYMTDSIRYSDVVYFNTYK